MATPWKRACGEHWLRSVRALRAAHRGRLRWPPLCDRRLDGLHDRICERRCLRSAHQHVRSAVAPCHSRGTLLLRSRHLTGASTWWQGSKDFSFPGDEFTTTTFAYRPGDSSWTTLTAPGLFGRFGATGMLLRDGRILIAGGFTASGTPPNGSAAPNLTSAQTFNSASSSWTNVANTPEPRQAPADGAVGCDGRRVRRRWSRRPCKRHPHEYRRAIQSTDRRVVVRAAAAIPHAAGGMALAPGGRLHLRPGGTRPGPSTQVLSLDTRPTARTWCGTATGFEQGALTGGGCEEPACRGR